MLVQVQVEEGLTAYQIAALIVTLLGQALAVLFVYRILVRGRSTSSSLLWMAVILAAPWIGLLLYYLLPRSLHLHRIRRIRRRSERVRQHLGASPEQPEATAGLAALFDDGGLSTGNDVRWLSGGEEFFAAVEKAIANAEHEVHCLIYILRPDEAGRRFLECLTAAARRGVEVRLLFDSFGSLGLKRSHLQPLLDAGGRAEAFLPLLWKRRPFTVNLRNHRKLLVVDGELAFVGGRNIGNEYRTDRLGRTHRWLDAMVSVQGPAVSMLQDVFVEDWCMATDEVIEEVARPKGASGGRQTVGVACSGPDRTESRLWFAVVQAIGEAKRSIEISSPYLIPPPVLLFALQLAVARGVRVRVHTNGPRTEAAVLYFAQRHFYRRLLAAGVELDETTEDYNHSKLIVVDGKTVIVGSANFDLRSADLNFEIALVVLGSPELASSVERTMAERREGCRPITERSLPDHPLARVVDGFCGLLAPLL